MRNLTRMFRTARILALAGLIAAGAAARAEAAPIVSISPAEQTANIGDTVSVDILVSGLVEPVGGYYLSLLFDETVLTPSSYTNDPSGALGPAPDDFSFGFLGGGALDLFYIADGTWDAGDLSAAQGGSFVLATVSFLAAANGVSPLILEFADLSNADGSALLDSSATNGQVCVGGPCPVPEPGLLYLLATAVVGLAVRRQSLRRLD